MSGLQPHTLLGDHGIGTQALRQDRRILLRDLRESSVFRNDALVAGAPGLRAYAGVPIRDMEGRLLGELCVLDLRPRTFTEDELQSLEDLAGTAAELLQNAAGGNVHTPSNYHLLFDAARDPILLIDLIDRTILDANRSAAALYGLPPHQLIGASIERFTTEPDGWDELNSFEGPEMTARWEAEQRDAQGRRLNLVITAALVRREGHPAALALIRDGSDHRKTKEALRRSEQQHRALIEQINDWVWRTDRQGRITYSSPQVYQILGRTPEEMIGRSPDEFMPAHAAREYRHKARWALQLGGPFHGLRTQMLHRDGTDVVLENNGVPYYDEAGHLLGYQGVARDVTARAREQRRLRLFESIVVHADDAVLVAEKLEDGGTAIRYVNRAFTDQTGFTSRAVEGQPLLFNAAAETDDEALHSAREALATNHSAREELLIERQDGSELWVETNLVPIPDGSGAVTHFISIQRDVTNRKETERRLSRITKAIGNSSDGIVITAPDGRFIYQNDAFRRLSGRSLEEINALPSPADLYEEALDLGDIHARIRSGESISGELNMIHREGHIVPVFVRADAVLDDQGDPIGIVGIHTDMTERRRAMQALEKTLERERELTELKSRFISMASHEFRTPLATIRSSAEMLDRFGHRWDESKRHDALHRIQRNVVNMTELLEDVLILGEAGAEGFVFTPEAMDVRSFALTLADEMRMGAGAHHLLQTDVPDTAVYAEHDPRLLRFILDNLISNAFKYSTEGTPISLQVEAREETIVYTIRDHGIGIPAPDQPHIFEPFHRGENASRKRGTGLGLSIVKQAVDAHRGRIELESTEGWGTSFRVMLPRMA